MLDWYETLDLARQRVREAVTAWVHSRVANNEQVPDPDRPQGRDGHPISVGDWLLVDLYKNGMLYPVTVSPIDPDKDMSGHLQRPRSKRFGGFVAVPPRLTKVAFGAAQVVCNLVRVQE